MKTILIADDDSTVLRLMEMDFLQSGAEVDLRSADSGEAAIAAIEAQKPDILVLDIRMPKGDGFSVLKYLQEKGHDLPVVVLTNYRNDEYIENCKSFSSVKEYIVKHEVKMNRVIDLLQKHLSR